MTRIAPAPARGPFVRYVYRETRKRYDRDLEPIEVTAHHRMLLAGMGAFEMALEKSKRVDERLKALAETKVALLVGCEFCIDIGSHISAHHGITDEQLLALPHHRDADCFDEPQLVELTAAIAWENWRARFNWAFDIGAAGFREGAACPVPAHANGAAA